MRRPASRRSRLTNVTPSGKISRSSGRYAYAPSVTIHNGVDTNGFAPGLRSDEARKLRAALEIAEERLVAVFVGGEWERKGLKPIIEALALARDWDLVVAGNSKAFGIIEALLKAAAFR